jgi:hypothetical protein
MSISGNNTSARPVADRETNTSRYVKKTLGALQPSPLRGEVSAKAFNASALELG